jgi:hypothetical protein
LGSGSNNKLTIAQDVACEERRLFPHYFCVVFPLKNGVKTNAGMPGSAYLVC